VSRPPRKQKFDSHMPRYIRTDEKYRRVTTRQMRIKIIAFGIFWGLTAIVLLYRFWYIKKELGSVYEGAAIQQIHSKQQSIRTLSISNRGMILDRNGQPIAYSQLAFNVFADIRQLSHLDSVSIDETIAVLHKTLDIPVLDLRTILERDADNNLIYDTHYYILAREISREIALDLQDSLLGIYAEEVSHRSYNNPFFASHIIGFLRGGSTRGLEKWYDTQLAGTNGQLVVDYTDHYNPSIGGIFARNGDTLFTTLDTEIQCLAQELVDGVFAKTRNGFVGMIVMNPVTGEILSMAQSPNYSLEDPVNVSLFTNSWDYDDWAQLSDADRLVSWHHIWTNNQISRPFEPGSIFMPFVVGAALDANVIGVDDIFICEGSHQTPDVPVESNCIYPGHGKQTISQVIDNSCEKATIDIMDKLGAEAFYQYWKRFGFGMKTGIDLPDEFAAPHPSSLYTLNAPSPDKLATYATGRGFYCTSIQLISAYASLINGGYIMKPFLGEQIIDIQNNIIMQTQPTQIRRAISEQTASLLYNEMHSAILSPQGNGYSITKLSHTLGGLVGEARQSLDQNKKSTTFVTYYPADNPQFLVLLVVNSVMDNNLVGNDAPSNDVLHFLQELIQSR